MLNEIENREFHIDKMVSEADSARSQATIYLAQSASAMKTETVGSGKNQTTIVVPDYAARAMYAAMSIEADSRASEYDQKAEDARRGGPVPTYTHDKIIDDDTHTRQNVDQFISEREARESKITGVKRLPKNNFKRLKLMVNKARAGLAGMAVGLIFLGEEAFAGKVVSFTYLTLSTKD